LTDPLEARVEPARADDMPAGLAEELYKAAAAEQFGLSLQQFVDALRAVGQKLNYGADAGVTTTPAQREVFLRGLHAGELALAQGCALGLDAAWAVFVARYRGPLTQAAIAITRSASMGEELADSLYSELFGMGQRDGVRWSPLSSYSGRGSLMGWLRTMLAQRHVNHFRQTRRESPLENVEVAAAAPAIATEQAELARLRAGLTRVFEALDAEERFLLSSYYLDQRTLLQIAGVLRVHEATASRKLKRVTEQVRKKLLKALETEGMSRRAAQEALGADPRDLDLNLRNLLQVREAATFLKKEGGA
jgi:RNA polymerase sigma-70 factor (ECF subfamily)